MSTTLIPVDAEPAIDGSATSPLLTTVPAFDYSTVSAEVAESLKRDAERIRLCIARSTEDLIAIGRDLNAAKRRLEHGQFIDWVQSEIGIQRRTAQRYMNVADFAEGKSVTVTLLPPGAAYKLAAKSTPPEIVDAVLQRVEAGERVTEEAVDGLIRQRKQQDKQQETRTTLEPEADSASGPGEPQPSEPRQVTPPVNPAAEETARTLHDKLGSKLARFVVEALRQDALAVLDMLQQVLAHSAASSARPSEPRPIERPSGSTFPDMPPCLDRRTSTEGAA